MTHRLQARERRSSDHNERFGAPETFSYGSLMTPILHSPTSVKYSMANRNSYVTRPVRRSNDSGDRWILAMNRYHRLRGDAVLHDERMRNRALVLEEFCWWYRTYTPAESMFEGLQSGGRKAQNSLRTDPQPVPPGRLRRSLYPTFRGAWRFGLLCSSASTDSLPLTPHAYPLTSPNPSLHGAVIDPPSQKK
jgi:hypothetical protein